MPFKLICRLPFATQPPGTSPTKCEIIGLLSLCDRESAAVPAGALQRFRLASGLGPGGLVGGERLATWSGAIESAHHDHRDDRVKENAERLFEHLIFLSSGRERRPGYGALSRRPIEIVKFWKRRAGRGSAGTATLLKRGEIGRLALTKRDDPRGGGRDPLGEVLCESLADAEEGDPPVPSELDEAAQRPRHVGRAAHLGQLFDLAVERADLPHAAAEANELALRIVPISLHHSDAHHAFAERSLVLLELIHRPESRAQVAAVPEGIPSDESAHVSRKVRSHFALAGAARSDDEIDGGGRRLGCVPGHVTRSPAAAGSFRCAPRLAWASW